MREKKAVKQLNRAGALISTVASRYAEANPHFQELLKSASATLTQAKGAIHRKAPAAVKKQSPPPAPATVANSTPAFTGSKTDFVRSVVEARGAAGVTPKEIDEAFSARKIARSKNLIYNALSVLVKQKKLAKKDGHYVLASPGSKPAPAATKKRISPEGLKRIIAANKKRWAAKKAADAKKPTGKKVAAR